MKNLTDYPEYSNWQAMKRRCTDPKAHSFERYGGRGIKVCSQWMESFFQFFADMGSRPSPIHSLDRFPDRDGNYEPGNVRWATPTQQMEHRRKSMRGGTPYRKAPKKKTWKVTPTALAVIRDPRLVLDRYEEGQTVRAIARVLGVSFQQVREVIEEAIGRRAA